MLYIGSHVGFKKNTQLLGSLEEALSYQENTFMFYTGAPQNTGRYPIDDALTEIKKEGQFKGTVKNDGAAQADVCVKALDNLIQDKSLTDGMTVVSTKEGRKANDKAVWYDSANKALRVHHAKITAETLK